MKTLLQYLPNQFFQTTKVALIVLGILIPQASFAVSKLKEQQSGLIETIEKSLLENKSSFANFLKESDKNTRVIYEPTSIKKIRIHPRFMKSILLNSNQKYLNIIHNNENICSFYSLLENNLLRTSAGRIKNIVFYYKDKKDNEHLIKSNLDSFIDVIHLTKCSKNRDNSKLFSNENIAKTVKDLTFQVPVGVDECSLIHDFWLRSANTPYLCKIAEKENTAEVASKKLKMLAASQSYKKKFYQTSIKEYNFYKKNISFFNRSYIKNICNSLSNKVLFCSKYLAEDVWSKIINGENPEFQISHKCKSAKNNKTLKKQDILACAEKFRNNKDYCIENGNKGYSSLFPLQDCNATSDALNNSRLKSDYHDCPGQIDNEAITNIHRIISHIKGSKTPSSPDACSFIANNSFANLNIKFQNHKAWPLKICHINEVTKKKICYSYIPGNNPKEKLSENNVIANLLIETQSAPKSTVCKVVRKNEYNPLRLEYKSGCFITYNAERCSMLHCPKKIIYENKVIKNLNYSGLPTFDYVPSSFLTKKFSMSNIITESFKVTNKKVGNLTELQYFLNRFKKGIIHGVGCVEDIIPEHFNRISFNQCKPIPFIIDGYKTKHNITKLVVRTSIDNVHSPRLVRWNHIFSAVASYKKFHPLRSWVLYGIK